MLIPLDKWYRTTHRVIEKAIKPSALCSTCRRRYYSRNTVKEGDTVLLKSRNDINASPLLTRPLKARGAAIDIGGAPVDQASVIGKHFLDVVFTKRGAWGIHQPTLAEYVTLSPRLVTPIYPADANLIVSLLDLHPSTPAGDGDENAPLEIFEAGTGHGSLTLYLARAVNGANPPAPPPSRVKHHLENSQSNIPDVESQDPASDSGVPPVIETQSLSPEANAAKERHETFQAYLPTRRAIIHSLDISPRFSEQAQRTVHNFRRGIYYHNVDFHVGTIPSYLSARLDSSPSPFLEHTILDLPGCHNYFEIVNQSLKPGGTLIVFCPSITQINTCVQVVKNQSLRWSLETVLELGVGAGVGGREWDVRFVKPRAILAAELEAKRRQREKQQQAITAVGDVNEDEGSNAEGVVEKIDRGWEMVCRPKVGGRISGGGFLAQWRKV